MSQVEGALMPPEVIKNIIPIDQSERIELQHNFRTDFEPLRLLDLERIAGGEDMVGYMKRVGDLAGQKDYEARVADVLAKEQPLIDALKVKYGKSLSKFIQMIDKKDIGGIWTMIENGKWN